MGDNRVVAGYHAGVLGQKYPEKVRPAMEAIIKLHEEGKVKPEIHEVFALEQVNIFNFNSKSQTQFQRRPWQSGYLLVDLIVGKTPGTCYRIEINLSVFYQL